MIQKLKNAFIELFFWNKKMVISMCICVTSVTSVVMFKYFGNTALNLLTKNYISTTLVGNIESKSLKGDLK